LVFLYRRYDFLLYSLMGSTISKLFFPATSTYAQALSYWGVFAGGFVTRPLGALIFGRIADK
jgi:MHS family proline/betaine transporter-like MFS transporter